MKQTKKLRFHYMEDPTVKKYIDKLPKFYRSEWVRRATKTLMEKEKKA